MKKEETNMLLYLIETQQIIIEQLNSVIDLLSEKFDIAVENGMMKVGEIDNGKHDA